MPLGNKFLQELIFAIFLRIWDAFAKIEHREIFEIYRCAKIKPAKFFAKT